MLTSITWIVPSHFQDNSLSKLEREVSSLRAELEQKEEDSKLSLEAAELRRKQLDEETSAKISELKKQFANANK